MSLYRPGDVTTTKTRGLLSREQSKSACEVVAGRVDLTFGTQGFVFTPEFVIIYMAYVNDKRSKNEKLMSPDRELKLFCRNSRRVFSCVRSKNSVIQHFGRISSLFTNSSENTRFHMASDLRTPLRTITLMNMS